MFGQLAKELTIPREKRSCALLRSWDLIVNFDLRVLEAKVDISSIEALFLVIMSRAKLDGFDRIVLFSDVQKPVLALSN